MNGLNELGVKEINEFYKENFRKYGFGPYKLGDRLTSKRTKRIKQPKGFNSETVLFTVDLQRCKPEGETEYVFHWFQVKPKHINCEIYEIEVIENRTQIFL